MKFNFLKQEAKEILDFEKEIGVEVVVNKFENKYWTQFENGWERKQCQLYGLSGVGATIDEAIKDLCRVSSKKELAIVIPFKPMVLFDVPTLCHTRKVEISKEELDEHGFGKYITPMTQAEAAQFAVIDGKAFSEPKSKEFIKGFEEGVMALYFKKFACRTL